MAHYSLTIPDIHAAMIKQAAKKAQLSEQDYLENLLIEDAENEARITLRSGKKCRTRCGMRDLKKLDDFRNENNEQ